MKLKIPFLSQQNNNHLNDCGPACVAMIAGVTIDKVLAAIDHPANQAMHLADIMAALSAYRLPHEHVRPLHLPDARRLLASGNPIIALIGYGRLPQVQRPFPYSGNHYVVIVGYTVTGFWVHDPLWPDERGAYRFWDDATLADAWLHVNAMPLQGVVVKRPYEVEEPHMGELGIAVSSALSQSVAYSYLEAIYAALGVPEGVLAERQGHALARVVQLRQGE